MARTRAMEHSSPPPISVRPLYAQAFGLARRDFAHSVLVPILIRAPWIFAMSILSSSYAERPLLVAFLYLIAFCGDILVWLMVSSMLRVRAESVFNHPIGTRPASATACYARGLSRLPWLFVTELARGILILIGLMMFILPAFYVAYRLAVATESTVLDGHGTGPAFGRSQVFMQGRFGAWFSMALVSFALIVGVAFFSGLATTTASVLIPGWPTSSGVAIGEIAVAAVLPIVQYAWAFFFLEMRKSVAMPAVGSAGAPHFVTNLPAPSDLRS